MSVYNSTGAENAIENYLNGNLTDAKRLARGIPMLDLEETACERFGKTTGAAWAIACFLKGAMRFQDCCDIEQRESEPEWSSSECTDDSP